MSEPNVCPDCGGPLIGKPRMCPKKPYRCTSQPAPQEPVNLMKAFQRSIDEWRIANEKTATEGAPLVPQEPSADIQAVRELYRDDINAMAQALIDLRADLAEARRELEERT